MVRIDDNPISYSESSGSFARGWLPGERLHGELEFYYRRSKVKHSKLLRERQSPNFFFEFLRVSPGDHLQAKEPEDSQYEIIDNRVRLETILFSG